MNDTYNQVIKQKEFGNYDLSAWQDDCTACANEVHNVNDPIPHECFMCVEYSPQTITYPLSGAVVAIFLVASFFLIKAFIRK